MLTGCLLTADPINPALDVPTGYRTPHSGAEAELPSAEWWRGFRSRELTELIDQALVANYDIAAAVGVIAICCDRRNSPRRQAASTAT